MTKAQRDIIRMVERHMRRWRTRLGLDDPWRIDLVFGEHYIDGAMGCVGLCDPDYRYLRATISFSIPALEQVGLDMIEELVVHELLHIIFAELSVMAGGMDEEPVSAAVERACTTLSRAITSGS